MAKSNAVVSAKWITPTMLNLSVVGAGIVEMDLTKCSESVRARFGRHGCTQRLCDRAAIPKNTETGKPATPQMKYEAIKNLADFYMLGGDGWSPGRAEVDPEVMLAQLIELNPELVRKLMDAREAKLANAAGSQDADETENDSQVE